MRRYSRKSFKRPKKKSYAKTYFFIILFLILAGGIFYFLCFWSGLKITKIKIEEQRLIKEQEIKTIVNSLLEEKKFYLVPQDKIFIFPARKIKEKLLGQFPMIKNIVLKRQLPDTLSLKIEEREKAGIWCLKESNDCFYFDKEGIIFHPAPLMLSSLTLSIFYSGQQIPNLGQQVMGPEDIEKIFQIQRLCQQETSVYLVSLENYQKDSFEFKFVTKPGWRVFFDARGDFKEQVYVLSHTLEKEIGENQINLDYIDLRVRNRAYYKYKEKQN